MAGADDAIIERCAAIADVATSELDALIQSGKRRKSQYDRQAATQLRVAARWCRKVADRIRALKSAPPKPLEEVDGPQFDQAIAILRELRPVVASARDSKWKATWLRRIDELISS